MNSIKKQIIILNILLVTFIFLCIIVYVSINSQEKLTRTIYHDMATKNEAYVNTIQSTFDAKAQTLLTLRDDLERYDTLGQMWVHIASHAGEKIFDDLENKKGHIKSFQKKLDTYKKNGQLSKDKLTPQVKRMLANITTNENAFGKGMKFFYIGMPIFNKNKTLQNYNQYQDSSLWVPDPNIENPYNPLIRPWYLAGKQAKRDKVVFTEPYAERRTKEAVSSIATVIDVNNIRGVFASAISIKPIIDNILSRFQENTHMTIFSKGTQEATVFVSTPPKYIYSSRDSSLGNHFKNYNDKEVIKNLSNKNIMQLYDYTKEKTAGVLEWKIDGKDRLVAFNTVPFVGWKIFTSVSKNKMMKEAIDLKYKIIFIAVIGILLLISSIYFIVNTALSSIKVIERELRDITRTGDLSKRITQLGSNEISKIAKDINQMLDNTVYPIKELGQVADKIAKGDLGAEINILAKGDIANLVNSFSKMTNRLIEFEKTSRDASPLTGLPGGISIENKIKNIINKQIPFAFCMFDLDNFKPFNDYYGYTKGNLVIKRTAEILKKELQENGNKDDFIGHIGGDDFVIITKPESYEKLCSLIIKKFDILIRSFYNEIDRQAGYIISKDRQGKTREIPIMSISISIVNSEVSEVTNYIHLGEICAELKSFVKKREGSNFIVCGRKKMIKKE